MLINDLIYLVAICTDRLLLNASAELELELEISSDIFETLDVLVFIFWYYIGGTAETLITLVFVVFLLYPGFFGFSESVVLGFETHYMLEYYLTVEGLRPNEVLGLT